MDESAGDLPQVATVILSSVKDCRAVTQLEESVRTLIMLGALTKCDHPVCKAIAILVGCVNEVRSPRMKCDRIPKNQLYPEPHP